MVRFEGIGKPGRTLAHSFHDLKAEADDMLDHLRQPIAHLLEEIAKEAGITLKRRASTAEYIGASLKQDGMGVIIPFTPDRFLCLSLSADSRCYGKLTEEILTKFTADRGYTMTGGILSKQVQLPEANTKEEGPQQVAQGAAFLRDEVEAWETLLDVMA